MDLDAQQLAGTSGISNWVDFYGREMVMLPATALMRKSETTSLSFRYFDTIEPHRLQYGCKTGSPSCEVSLTSVLTEKELGPFPQDYRNLFPEEFRKIQDRITSALAYHKLQ